MRGPSPDRVLAALRPSPELAPGLLAVAVFLAWALSEGGFAPTSLYPGGLFLLGLLLVTSIAYRSTLVELPRAVLVAGGLLAAFVAWSYLSITWAAVAGDAWEGANRSLVYLSVYVLFAVPRWRASAAAVVLGFAAVGVAAIGVASLLEARGAVDPTLSFVNARFAEPTGYHNASVALFLGALWPALFLASRRELPWPARAILMAAAGVLIELAIIPQSRGSSIVVPIVLILYLVVVPGRMRALATLVPVVAVAALAAGPMLDVFTVANDGGDVAAVLDDALRVMSISAVVLGAVGAALGIFDRRLAVPVPAQRFVARATVTAGAAVAIVAAVVILSSIGSPVSWGTDRWQEFKAGNSGELNAGTRFGGSLGSNRYDFWRVSLSAFADAPLGGAGSDNFAHVYLRDGRSDEEPFHPHGLPFKLLGETGIVGGALFGGFVVAALLGAGRVRARGPSALSRGLAGVAIVTFAYWALHASGEWLWAFPAVTAPALAWLGIAGRLGADPKRTEGVRRSHNVRPIALWTAVAAVATLAAASYLFPWAAARDVQIAAATWGANPEAAFERLDRARALNPLSARADLLAGTIASRVGDLDRTRTAFTRALERDPKSWYAQLELGALDSVEGRRGLAREHLDAAAELSPRDPLIAEAQERLASGRPIPLEFIERELLGRVCARVGRTEDTRYCD